MLLCNLLNGKETSNLIVLQDTIEVSARPLLLSFAKSLLNRMDLLCLVCYELPPKKFLKLFDADLQSRVECIDVYTDYLKWHDFSERNEGNSLVCHDSHIVLINAVRESINERYSLNKNGGQLKVALAIDSISKLLFRSVPHACQMLQQLLHSKEVYQVEQVVCVVHTDLHDSHTLHSFCSIATSVLEISRLSQSHKESVQGNNELKDQMDNYCKTLHIRKTGKVFKKKQRFIISKEFEVKEFQEEEWNKKPAIEDVTKSRQPEIDPTSNLPFNLKLSEEEEQARAKTQLPYIHHSNQNTIGPSIGKDSKIFYQPDDADDFDEDDPDNDLDI